MIMKIDTSNKISHVLRFWFEELVGKQHFEVNLSRDTEMRKRFSALHQEASHGELFSWRISAEGRLAEIIILDQFSRNIFRGKPLSFAQDGMALCLAQEAVLLGLDKKLPPSKRMFLYMPYMHSESLLIHNLAVPLFESLANEDNSLSTTLDFEYRHRVIIERFGRYPHRNKILGRVSSTSEKIFLSKPGSSF